MARTPSSKRTSRKAGTTRAASQAEADSHAPTAARSSEPATKRAAKAATRRRAGTSASTRAKGRAPDSPASATKSTKRGKATAATAAASRAPKAGAKRRSSERGKAESDAATPRHRPVAPRRGADLVIGIDLGGTKILAAVVDTDGKIVASAKNATMAERGPEGVTARIEQTVDEALAAAGKTFDDIVAVGVGSPGPLDPDTGVIITTPNLGWKNFPLGERLSKAFHRPVFVDNDVKLGTFGEVRRGAGVGASSVVGMFVGTGIGGGIVMDGKILHGAGKNAAEIGHTVVLAGGPRCGCGVRGHLEALASRTSIERDLRDAVRAGGRTSLERYLRKHKHDHIRSTALYEAYKKGDPLTRKVVDRATKFIGIGIGNMLNAISPERVVLGGGLFEAFGDELLRRVRKAAKKASFQTAYEAATIVVAKLGEDAGVIGAAELARDKIAES